MTAAAREAYGNPSSIHTPGQAARRAVDAARGEVAALLGASRKRSFSPAAAPRPITSRCSAWKRGM